MGNNILPLNQSQNNKILQLEKAKSQQEYAFISDRIDSIVGKPRLVRSNITNIELQQYYISNPQNLIQMDINLYKLRSSSYSKNMVVVFHHKLIDQSEKLFMVRIQKMKGRLSQIQGLSYTQSLCLLQAALNGFSELVYHAKTPFAITQKMIGLNQTSMVRVWVNENFALNKIMPGIKVRNQNIMVHQLFSAVADHVANEQRQAFSNVRFKIAECQKIIDAKNIISMILQNCNRRSVLQELVERQMLKLNRNNPNFKSPSQPNFNQPGQNQPINPMIIGSLSLTGTPSNTPLSPINPMITTVPIESGPEKIHIQTEQYIKDDEGSDRIRVMRHQRSPNPTIPIVSNTPVTNPNVNINIGNPNLPIIYGNPTHGKQVVYDFSHNQPVIIPTRRMHPDQNESIGNRNKTPQLSNGPIVTQQMPLVKKQSDNSPMNVPAVASNINQRNGMRTTSIFGNKIQSDENNDLKIMRSPRAASPRAVSPRAMSPRAVSPIKQKNSFIESNSQKPSPTINLTTKIALSQNKISQMQKKLNKLKQQFTKNNQKIKGKHNNPYDVVIRRDENNKVRLNVTPDPSTMARLNMTEDLRMANRYEREKIKTQTAIGQTAMKLDRRLASIITYNSHIKENQLQNERKGRKSQILTEEQQKISYLRKSMITELPSHVKTQLAVASTPKHIQSQGSSQDDFIMHTPKRDISPTFHPIDENTPNKSTSFIIKQGNPSISNGIYLGNVDKNGTYRAPQPKMQINFNGNPLVTRIHNGYGNILENKSSVIPRNSHF